MVTGFAGAIKFTQIAYTYLQFARDLIGKPVTTLRVHAPGVGQFALVGRVSIDRDAALDVWLILGEQQREN